MSLLTLPAELRLRVYDYLPDLQPNRIETLTAHSALTPAISRVNTLLRHETLSIFTSNSTFTAALDDGAPFWPKRLTTWMNSLSPPLPSPTTAAALSLIRSLQLSRHWNIPAPMRWQGHVGFYVRVEKPRRPKKASASTTIKTASTSSSTESLPTAFSSHFIHPVREAGKGNWTITAGTYPTSQDIRSKRRESVEVLAKVIRQYFAASRRHHHHHHHHHRHRQNSQADADDEDVGLQREDVVFLLRAMEIVASHPVPTTYQNVSIAAGRGEVATATGQYERAWVTMNEKLRDMLVEYRECCGLSS
ncbi:hypothetical protein BST61_g5895 [Cercospora zeina]